MRSLLLAVVLVVTSGVSGACGKNSTPPPPSSGSPNAKPESGPSHAQADGQPSVAQLTFSTVCAACHGIDGKGNGPAAVALNPKPRDYTDPAWQASITDDQIKETIVKGGQAVGKSATMPGQAQLKSQPEVLDGLVRIIRSFGKHP
jgi:cytochrome c553